MPTAIEIVEAERERRAANACCNGAGHCGIDDCDKDAAVDAALADVIDKLRTAGER